MKRLKEIISQIELIDRDLNGINDLANKILSTNKHPKISISIPKDQKEEDVSTGLSSYDNLASFMQYTIFDYSRSRSKKPKHKARAMVDQKTSLRILELLKENLLTQRSILVKELEKQKLTSI